MYYVLLFFFFQNFGGHKSFFVGPLISPVLDFLWHLLWVSKLEWAALFTPGGVTHVTYSSRFTPGATLINLLAASMAAKPFSAMYLWPRIGGAGNRDQADALMTGFGPFMKSYFSSHYSFHYVSLPIEPQFIPKLSLYPYSFRAASNLPSKTARRSASTISAGNQFPWLVTHDVVKRVYLLASHTTSTCYSVPFHFLNMVQLSKALN